MRFDILFRHSLLAGIACAAFAVPASAQILAATQDQVQQIDKRVNVIERQMRAVQRKVFPGDDRFFEPEIVAPATPQTPGAAPASTPLADLTQRVTVIEQQQRDLTGRIEELQHQITQLKNAQEKFRGDAEFRLNTLEGNLSATPGAPGQAVAPATASGAFTPPGAAASPVPVNPAPIVPSAPAPNTPEAIEAQYMAGYNKYTAKDYAGAVTDLTAFLGQHPKHARASNAQFWIGRSLLAQDQNAQAAKAFLAGYQNYPRGERAHNSLLYLGKSLLKMNQAQAACQALDQLNTAYPDKLTGQFAADVKSTRAQAKCG